MQNNYNQQYNQQYNNQQVYTTDSNRLITPWGYIGYSLLFSIPIIGFIMALVFSFSSEYPCRRNYARSVLIGFVIALVIGLIVYFAAGASLSIFNRNGYRYY